MKNQKIIVREKLEKKGHITNLWALQNGIWRLSARINELRAEGMDIKTIIPKDKNTKYTYENIDHRNKGEK